MRGWVGLGVLLFSVFSYGAQCPGRWVEYSNRPYESALFPETHAIYYRFTFRTNPLEPLALKFTQKQENARYVSYALYDQSSMTSIASVSDPEGNDPYSVVVSTVAQPVSNQLRIPMAASPASYEVWYRAYLPMVPLSMSDLPKVEALNANTGEPVDCPISSPKKIQVPMDITQLKRLPPGPTETGAVYFYGAEPSRIFSNQQTQYLAARLDWNNKPMAVIEVMPPTFPQVGVLAPWDSFDVRYWSFCLASGVTTRTSGCVADYELPRGADGKVRFLIAPETVEGRDMRALATSKGMGFLERGQNFVPVILYRNIKLRKDFGGLFPAAYYWPPSSEVPKDEAKVTHRAEEHIGDFAPRGQLMTLEEYLKLT